MAGGSIEKLKEMMRHSSVQVTERYAHLRPDAFSDRDRGMIAVDLEPPGDEPGANEREMSAEGLAVLHQ